MALTPAQQNAALGRLARTDVVGLRHGMEARNYAAIEDLAVKRLVAQGLATDATADFLYGAMLRLLQEARLTISIKCFNWFYAENKSKEYSTFFIRGASGASNDMIKRDGAEKQMFGYGDAAPTGASREEKAKARIVHLGNLQSADFQGAMRPRYAAVDFAYCVNGGLSKYGKSFFVLGEHMKHNATYCHCDSFEVEADMLARQAEYGRVASLSDVLATYHELGKVIYYCHPAMLKKLAEYARSQKKGSENNLLGGNIYIEAQVHADLVFERDVAQLCISDAERTVGPSIHPRWNAGMFRKKTTWDAADATKVETHAKAFAKANKIFYKTVV